MSFNFFRRFAKEQRNRFNAWRQCRGVEQQNPVFVYQMGKVGSTTVVNAIKSLDPKIPVVHVHTLTNQGINQATSKIRQTAGLTIPEHLFVSSILNRLIAENRFLCRIITLTREPVSRAVSLVFEDWRKKAPGANKNGKLDVGLMLAALNEMLSGENGNSDPTMWFNHELKAVFNIDVFNKPFDFERGYSTFSNGNISLLLMRMEDLDRCLPTALGEFLNINVKGMTLVRENRGEVKWYADSLAELNDSYQISQELLARIHNTRYFNHFYSQDPSQ